MTQIPPKDGVDHSDGGGSPPNKAENSLEEREKVALTEENSDRRGNTKDHPLGHWFMNFSEADELLKLAGARQQDRTDSGSLGRCFSPPSFASAQSRSMLHGGHSMVNANITHQKIWSDTNIMTFDRRVCFGSQDSVQTYAVCRWLDDMLLAIIVLMLAVA
uniref:Uncharacterized protein n=1 Tax=Chenopodium quinoa TaxID=63459 RepID=A0A803M5C6_CHEQI